MAPSQAITAVIESVYKTPMASTEGRIAVVIKASIMPRMPLYDRSFSSEPIQAVLEIPNCSHGLSTARVHYIHTICITGAQNEVHLVKLPIMSAILS